MNRFTAAALLEEATRGRVVLVVTHTHDARRWAFDEFLPLADAAGATVRRANGGESISTPAGGRVLFASAQGTSLRVPCDVVFVDGESADVEVSRSRGGYEHLRACIATSKNGEIVRA